MQQRSTTHLHKETRNGLLQPITLYQHKQHSRMTPVINFAVKRPLLRDAARYPTWDSKTMKGLPRFPTVSTDSGQSGSLLRPLHGTGRS
jgi:hypothetical protein